MENALLLLLSGVAEIAFTAALTVVGERESPHFHVVFFSGFLLSCAVHLPLVAYNCSRTRLQLAMRTALITTLLILIPSISTAFFLNLHYCVKNCESELFHSPASP